MALAYYYAVLLMRPEGRQPETVNWPGESEHQVRQEMSAVGQVLQVHRLGPVIDWGRNTYTVEEAAEFLRCSVRKIEQLMEEGRLPRNRTGEKHVFTRAMLERVMEQRMGRAA